MGKKRSPNKTNTNEAKYCGICNRNFNKSEYKLLCNGRCSTWICQKCSGLSKAGVQALITDNQVWVCRDCQNSRSSSSRRSIVVHDEPENSESENVEEGEEFQDCTIADIMKQLRFNHENMKSELKTLKNDIVIIQQSMQFLSDSFDDIQRENISMKKRLMEQEELNAHTGEKVRILEDRIVALEQEKRERNLIVTNIPVEEEKNTNEVVVNLMEFMGLSAEVGEFSAKRLSKKEAAPILVELRNSQTRNLLIQKRREKGILRASDLGCSGDNIVYLNEDLPKSKQELFAKVRKTFKVDRKFKYVWIKNGKIYVKKTEFSKAALIRSEEDFSKVA